MSVEVRSHRSFHYSITFTRSSLSCLFAIPIFCTSKEFFYSLVSFPAFTCIVCNNNYVIVRRRVIGNYLDLWSWGPEAVVFQAQRRRYYSTQGFLNRVVSMTPCLTFLEWGVRKIWKNMKKYTKCSKGPWGVNIIQYRSSIVFLVVLSIPPHSTE